MGAVAWALVGCWVCVSVEVQTAVPSGLFLVPIL